MTDKQPKQYNYKHQFWYNLSSQHDTMRKVKSFICFRSKTTAWFKYVFDIVVFCGKYFCNFLCNVSIKETFVFVAFRRSVQGLKEILFKPFYCIFLSLVSHCAFSFYKLSQLKRIWFLTIAALANINLHKHLSHCVNLQRFKAGCAHK